MSDFFASIPTWVLLVGAVALGFVVVYLIFRSMWRVAEPNQALIISGGLSGNPRTENGLDFKIVTGRGVFVIPGLQTVRPLDLSLYETELDVDCVTHQGIQVVVKGVVIFKIGDSEAFIANAARRFLGHQDQMKGQVYNVFEGHLRSIIGSLTVEEMIRDRDKLTGQVRQASGTEMEKLGLVVDSLQIKDFKDPSNYITNLAKPHIAQVQMEARISEAARNREASEREAEAAALIAAAQSESDIQQSAARAKAEQAKAEAAQAGPLAEATARQQVVVQETHIATLEAEREAQRLEATVRKPADAAAYRITKEAEAARDAAVFNAQAEASRTRLAAEAQAEAAKSNAAAVTVSGEAEAAATKAKGEAAAAATEALAKAEAAGIEARAKALKEGQEAVIAQQVAEKLPEMIKAAASAFDNVDNMTVLNGADGVNGMVNGIIAQVGNILPQVLASLKSNSTTTEATPTANGKAPQPIEVR